MNARSLRRIGLHAAAAALAIIGAADGSPAAAGQPCASLPLLPTSGSVEGLWRSGDPAPAWTLPTQPGRLYRLSGFTRSGECDSSWGEGSLNPDLLDAQCVGLHLDHRVLVLRSIEGARLSVGFYGIYVGGEVPFRLLIEDLGEVLEDWPNLPGEAASVAPGADGALSRAGRIDYEGDRDAFSLPLDGLRAYVLSARARWLQPTSPSMLTTLRVQGIDRPWAIHLSPEAGALFAERTQIVRLPAGARSGVVEVSASTDPGTEYEWSLTPLESIAPPPAPGDAGTTRQNPIVLTPAQLDGEEFAITLHGAADARWFAVDADARRRYALERAQEQGPGEATLSFEWYAADSPLPVSDFTDSFWPSGVVYAPAPGRLLVRAFNRNSWVAQANLRLIRGPEQPIDDAGNTVLDATPVHPGSVVAGSLGAGDVDVFRTALLPGGRYAIEVRLRPLPHSYPVDVLVFDATRTFAAEQSWLVRAYGQENEPTTLRFPVAVPQTGVPELFVRVGAPYGVQEPPFHYTIQVVPTGGPSELVPARAPCSAPLPLTVDEPLTQVPPPLAEPAPYGGPREPPVWFAVHLQAGRLFEASTLSRAGPGPRISIFDACDVPLTLSSSADYFLRDPTVHYVARRTGLHLLKVEVSADLPWNAYEVLVRDAGPAADDAADHPAAAALSPTNTWLDRAIDHPADVDAFRFAVNPSSRYVVEIEAVTPDLRVSSLFGEPRYASSPCSRSFAYAPSWDARRPNRWTLIANTAPGQTEAWMDVLPEVRPYWPPFTGAYRLRAQENQCIADVAAIGGGWPADGQLTVDDYTAFIDGFANDHAWRVDIVGIGGLLPPDGSITVDDYTAFINSFAAGCD